VLAVLAVFSLVNFPDALLLLRLHDLGVPTAGVVLAYAGYNLAYAALSTVAASRTEALLDKGDSIASALTEGFHVAYGFSAGLLWWMVVAVVVLRRPNAEVSVPVLSA
jgi:hypothetical protein